MLNIRILGTVNKIHRCGCRHRSGSTGCGNDFDLLKEVEDLEVELKKDYDYVDLKFLDIISDDVNQYNEILKLVDSGLVNLPITIINDLPRYHGGIEYKEIKDIIDKKMDK